MLLCVGDDWAEDHHDIEIQDGDGRRLRKARIPEGVPGIARFHTLVGECVGQIDPALVQIVVGIETERGMWVQALVAAGYQVYPINPLQVARYRTRCGVSGAKSDSGDAHVLADMVRTDRAHLRQCAGDSELVEAIQVLTRAHKTLIWERTRHLSRLRQILLDFFPAALDAYPKLTDRDVLELLTAAPDPASAAQLTEEQITAALRRARRHNVPIRVAEIQGALRQPRLDKPTPAAAAHAVLVRSQAAILTTLNAEVKTLEQQVKASFRQHPAVQVYLSQPGLAHVLGARLLAEFGDDPGRYRNARARKNYAGTSPITRQSGKKKTVLTRYVHNDRLVDALGAQAFAALTGSPGARAYYQRQRDRGVGHRAALRQVGNRLVGILHGCLKTQTVYDEHIAWAHQQDDESAAA